MKKLALFIFVLLYSFACFAQNQVTDSLSYQRGLFASKAYKLGVKQDNAKLKYLYKKNSNFKAERLLNKSKVMLPIGAATSVAGVALGVDALIGTKKSVIIEGTQHNYVERSIFQLLSGVALFASGICIMEFGNDAKIKSIETYNKKRNLNGKVGFTKSGNVGIQIGL